MVQIPTKLQQLQEVELQSLIIGHMDVTYLLYL